MEQIVGQKCVRCLRSIDSIVEGEFCLYCGQAVHVQCVSQAASQSPDHCDKCGSVLDSEEAVAERLHQLEQIGAERAIQNNLRAEFAHTDLKERFQAKRELIMGVILLLLGIPMFGIASWGGIPFALIGIVMIGRSWTKV